MTAAAVLAHEAKLKRGVVQADAAPAEEPLQNEIAKYCCDQFPRWPFIRARMDKATTTRCGVHDFTIFMPRGRVLCLECKSKTGKLTEQQTIWAYEMGKQGHTVYVVRSMAEFLSVVHDTTL